MTEDKLTLDEVIALGMKTTDWVWTPYLLKYYKGSLTIGREDSSNVDVIIEYDPGWFRDSITCELQKEGTSCLIAEFKGRRRKNNLWDKLYKHAESCYQTKQKAEEEKKTQMMAGKTRMVREYLRR
jgi:hypothetical protein